MIEIKNEGMFTTSIDLTKESDVRQIIKFVRRKQEKGKSPHNVYVKVLDYFFDYVNVVSEGTKRLAEVIVDDVYGGLDDDKIVTTITDAAKQNKRPKREIEEEKRQQIHSNVELFISAVYEELEDRNDELVNFGIQCANDYLTTNTFDSSKLYQYILKTYQARRNIARQILHKHNDTFYIVCMIKNIKCQDGDYYPVGYRSDTSSIWPTDLKFASYEDIKKIENIEEEVCDTLSVRVLKYINEKKSTEICIACEKFVDSICQEISRNRNKLLQYGLDFAEDYLCTHNFDAPELYHAIVDMYDDTVIKRTMHELNDIDSFIILNGLVFWDNVNEIVSPCAGLYLLKLNSEKILIDKKTLDAINNVFEVKTESIDTVAKEVVRTIRRWLVGNLNK